jgi:hypothetical protein
MGPQHCEARKGLSTCVHEHVPVPSGMCVCGPVDGVDTDDNIWLLGQQYTMMDTKPSSFIIIIIYLVFQRLTKVDIELVIR